MVKVIGLYSGSSFDGIAGATINAVVHYIPAASGATRFGILGKLVQPPRLGRV